MLDVRILVGPAAGGGWRIDCDLPLEPAYFRSGARAEQAARALAARVSVAGFDAKVVIADRRDRVVATQRYFAPDRSAAESGQLAMGPSTMEPAA